MKKKHLIVCGFFAVMFVLAFVACPVAAQSINSATELKAYLDKQPANSSDKPIKVAMKVNEMMIKDIVKVIEEAGKYVSLNLTGSPLTEIPGGAFRGCKTLAGITIPEGVTSIGEETFSNCTSLTTVTFAEGSKLKTIGKNAFKECTSLTSVIILPASLTTGAREFDLPNLTDIKVAAGNPNYASEGGILYNKAKTELIFAVKGIKGSITIPSSVTSIGNYAFAYCTGLTSITIPAGVTSIGDGAFALCTGLTSITVAAGNPSYSSEGGILYNKAKTELIFAPQGISGNVTIPAGVTSIGLGAFYSCTSLTSVTIPAGVTSIGDSAFFECTSLTSVTIPASVTSIGDNTFFRCTSLTSVTIPSSVTSIGEMAFSGCKSLRSITIPAGVTSIGDNTFRYWTSSQTINVQGHANQQAADAAWGYFIGLKGWRRYCDAVIKYWNGSSYQ